MAPSDWLLSGEADEIGTLSQDVGGSVDLEAFKDRNTQGCVGECLCGDGRAAENRLDLERTADVIGDLVFKESQDDVGISVQSVDVECSLDIGEVVVCADDDRRCSLDAGVDEHILIAHIAQDDGQASIDERLDEGGVSLV